MTECTLRRVTGILELAGEYENHLSTIMYGPDDTQKDAAYLVGYDEESLTSVKSEFENSSLNGWNVRFVDLPSIHDEEITKIPHFGHGMSNCGSEEHEIGDELDCDVEGEGALRLFGCSVIVSKEDGTGDYKELMDTYEIFPGVRFRLTGVGRPSKEFNERDTVEDTAPFEQTIPNWITDVESELEKWEHTIEMSQQATLKRHEQEHS